MSGMLSRFPQSPSNILLLKSTEKKNYTQKGVQGNLNTSRYSRNALYFCLKRPSSDKSVGGSI
jgi:hypothetical protein